MTREEFKRLKIGDRVRALVEFADVPVGTIGMVKGEYKSSDPKTGAPERGLDIRWVEHPEGKRFYAGVDGFREGEAKWLEKV